MTPLETDHAAEPAGRSAAIEESACPQVQDAEPNALPAVDLVPMHLLDGGEIVILAVKPSLWFIVFVSFRWVAAMVCVILLDGWLGRTIPFLDAALIARGAAVLAAARFGFAALQWASRLYVLTNRRILRLQGVVNIDLFECPLSRIQNTVLTLTWYERPAGLGTISFATAGTGAMEAAWLHVNRPLEVHEQVRSAIDRARGPGNGV